MNASITEQKVWTNLSLLEWSSQYLADRSFESPRLNCELLLCEVLHCRRLDLYLKFDTPLSSDDLARFKRMFKRRLTHEPLQYIVGETEFMGLRIKVDPRALIPRPETEILVEEIIRLARANSSPTRRILEVGTGSGNIAIALVTHLEGWGVDTIDVSKEALELARANIKECAPGSRILLIEGDFLNFPSDRFRGKYDMIVSNPPYIPREDFPGLQAEVLHEPQIATTDGADGLTFYNAIASKGKELLQPGGRIAVEISFAQEKVVARLFEEGSYNEINIIPDYGGIKRVITARLK